MTKKTETVKSDADQAMNDLADHLAAKLRDRAAAEAAELDAIFAQAAADGGRELNFEEKTRILQIRPSWSDSQIKQESRRAREVSRLQSVAGTREDREALESALKVAREARETQGAKLENEIQKLQGQLHELESTEARLAKRVEDVDQALQRLTEVVPEVVRVEIQNRTRAMTPALTERNAISEELRHRDRLLGGPGERMTERDWCEHLQREGVRAEEGSQGRVRPNGEQWARLQASWASERPAQEQRLVELNRQIAAAEAEIQSLRESLWR